MEERINDIESDDLSCSVCLNDTIENEQLCNRNQHSDLSCSICLNEKIDEEILCNTNCDHNFCKECLIDWFNQGKNTCPLCRTVLKSYMNHNQETKLITIQTRRPPSIDNVVIHGRSGREVITDLINHNLKLRYMLFMVGFSGVLLLLFYLILKDDYDELFINYHRCIDNYTNLSADNQDMNHILSDIKLVRILYDSTHYNLCNIPRLYYNSCFGNKEI